MKVPERVIERVYSKVIVRNDGCIESTYSVGSHGYPQVGWQEGGKTRTVTCHRTIWEAEDGRPIPEGYTVDHTCKNKRCINYEHLRLLPNFENARRTDGRDWELGECANGHDNSELYLTGGRWKCRPCDLAAKTRYNRKMRAR